MTLSEVEQAGLASRRPSSCKEMRALSVTCTPYRMSLAGSKKSINPSIEPAADSLLHILKGKGNQYTSTDPSSHCDNCFKK